jgi:hypothetical protein
MLPATAKAALKRVQRPLPKLAYRVDAEPLEDLAALLAQITTSRRRKAATQLVANK